MFCLVVEVTNWISFLLLLSFCLWTRFNLGYLIEQVSMGYGTITAYALMGLEPRGTLFVRPGMEVILFTNLTVSSCPLVFYDHLIFACKEIHCFAPRASLVVGNHGQIEFPFSLLN